MWITIWCFLSWPYLRIIHFTFWKAFFGMPRVRVIWVLAFFGSCFSNGWDIQFVNWPFNCWWPRDFQFRVHFYLWFSFFFSFFLLSFESFFELWLSSSPWLPLERKNASSNCFVFQPFFIPGERFDLRKVRNGHLCHFHMSQNKFVEKFLNSLFWGDAMMPRIHLVGDQI